MRTLGMRAPATCLNCGRRFDLADGDCICHIEGPTDDPPACVKLSTRNTQGDRAA